MSNHMKHTEKVHINEQTRVAKGTIQWFLTEDGELGRAPPPITHNNKLEVFMCGEAAFADIAEKIAKAEKSIEICCWGFDPGMELVRDEKKSLWPRGETFGDLLIAAGKRKVEVSLLVWLKAPITVAGAFTWDKLNPKNLPGWTHDTYFFNNSIDQKKADQINALRMLAEHRAPYLALLKRSGKRPDAWEEVRISREARAQYCDNWFRAARGLDGKLSNITVVHRTPKSDDVSNSLGREANPPDLEELEGMALAASHHQKTILIDYADQDGKNAIGYVMGLNSLTGYWDSEEHKIEDFRRERGGEPEKKEAVQPLKPDDNRGEQKSPPPRPDPGFYTLKPYQDYACRIEGGALVSVHHNFMTGWLYATMGKSTTRDLIERDRLAESPPRSLLSSKGPGNSTVQIVRTQPAEKDKTIKEIYFQATDMAVLTGGYLYLENQYFQYEEWAQRVIKQRKANVALWECTKKNSGKRTEDMPVLHVFIVAPVAELEQMVPRTYDTLATLGKHGGMYGQEEFIKEANAEKSDNDVVRHANGIAKPTDALLEDGMHMKVAAAMLQTSGVSQGFDGKRRMRYREIYIHSKLLLINDCFFTLGSGNLNQRSMAGDSELNLATNDRKLARKLRKKVWKRLSGEQVEGGTGSSEEIRESFRKWVDLMNENRWHRMELTQMTGFLLPFEDGRSATWRLA